jgi:hypothetical protein
VACKYWVWCRLFGCCGCHCNSVHHCLVPSHWVQQLAHSWLGEGCSGNNTVQRRVDSNGHKGAHSPAAMFLRNICKEGVPESPVMIAQLMQC